MENLTITDHIEGKKYRGSQRATYLRSLCKWIGVQGSGALAKGEKSLRTTRDRKLWRDLIAYILKEETSRHINIYACVCVHVHVCMCACTYSKWEREITFVRIVGVVQVRQKYYSRYIYIS